MDTDILKHNINISACPECGAKLNLISADSRHLLMCDACSLVYPVINGIPVILALTARNPALEKDAVTEFIENTAIEDGVKRACLNTIAHLNSIPEASGWELKDEKHWSEIYKKRMNKAPSETRWNSRLWQRQPIINPVLQDDKLSSKKILDIGCGEGQNFRLLFRNACRKQCLYIADLKHAVYSLDKNFDVVYEGAFFTIFHLLAAKGLGALIDKYKWIYKTIATLDKISSTLFGWIIPLFIPSEQRYLLHKKQTS